MKKVLQLFLLVAVLMVSFTYSADAQYGRKKKKKKKKSSTEEYFDDRGGFKDRLWYGADFSLNFYGVNGGNAFAAGIAPMVGYKITENFSAGPRLEVLYRGERYDVGGSQDLKFNSTNLGVGAFARLKILDMYFIQTEYQSLSNEVGTSVDVANFKVLTDRVREDHFYIGGGYSGSTGLLGFQATLLWDLTQEFSSQNIPLSYRIGINYKF